MFLQRVLCGSFLQVSAKWRASSATFDSWSVSFRLNDDILYVQHNIQIFRNKNHLVIQLLHIVHKQLTRVLRHEKEQKKWSAKHNLNISRRPRHRHLFPWFLSISQIMIWFQSILNFPFPTIPFTYTLPFTLPFTLRRMPRLLVHSV